MQNESSNIDSPALSIVIASVNGYEYISQCLESLKKQRSKERAEVIVVEGSGDNTAEKIGQNYPWVQIVPCPEPRPIPQLRAIGVRQSRASIVVTTEDHCIFHPSWYERILQAHREHPEAAIGGAVENGSCERLVDWAAYICEYGKFMLPFSPGPENDLPGPNVSYKKECLEKSCADLLNRGVWENVLHAQLLADGHRLRIDPSIVVYHAKRFGFWDFLAQRYYFGRSFAATRVAQAPLGTKAFFVTISLFLPPLLLWRYAKTFFGKRRFMMEVVKTMPLLVAFAIAWSVGEFLGYGFGDGGSSLRVK